jgi:caffeoyl-CoA O-methyltransferase
MIQLVHPELEAYAEAHTSPLPPLLDELRAVTYSTMASPEMQVGRIEGTLLKLLVALSGARRVVEVGTFTGYSALRMAEALPDDGELVTCEIDPVAAKTAQAFFDRSPHGKKIRLALRDALVTLRALPQAPSFDLAFLDADKERYALYYQELIPRIRPGGLLVADNTLWSGRVLSPRPGEETDRAIVAFNRLVAEDARVESVLLPVRDGITLARKVAS